MEGTRKFVMDATSTERERFLGALDGHVHSRVLAYLVT
jgi:hypothetical protein